MKYVIYCDESREDGRFMAIGGLWVPRSEKAQISRSFRDLCRERGLNAEIKWSKVSSARLDDYKALIDFFFQTKPLSFRVIVVDQSKVDLAKFHDGDRELGFYKFYYQMLKAWITKGNDYLVLLDFKQNKNRNRYGDLRRIVARRAAKTNATLADLTVIDSQQSPLAQLCDLLTGSVAASACSDTRASKLQLADYIAASAHLSSLGGASPSPDFCKFNIFRIRLRTD